MTLYKKAVEELISLHKQDFDAFKPIHDLYGKDQITVQEEFNRLGRPILRAVEDAERKLCSKMESGGKAKYSAGLAEKFRAEVKKVLPYLDFIGAKVE